MYGGNVMTCENCRYSRAALSEICPMCLRYNVPRTDRWAPSKQFRTKSEEEAEAEEERQRVADEEILMKAGAGFFVRERDAVLGLIESSQERYGVTVEFLLEEARKLNIPEGRVKVHLKDLAYKANIYQPRCGRWKVTGFPDSEEVD
jgi:hypothetical protein